MDIRDLLNPLDEQQHEPSPPHPSERQSEPSLPHPRERQDTPNVLSDEQGELSLPHPIERQETPNLLNEDQGEPSPPETPNLLDNELGGPSPVRPCERQKTPNLLNEDQSEPSPPHPCKRQKTRKDVGRPVLRHEDYTIAWICAPHIELAAALTMLDETHASLPTSSGDTNTYTLGRIQGKNVVIACSPGTQNGLNNRASLVTNLRRTFPSIQAGLMEQELCRVIWGKLLGVKSFAEPRSPRFPDQRLGKAVSSLRAKHELHPSRVSSIIRDTLDGHPEYTRPQMPDRLFQATYNHVDPDRSCDNCDETKLVLRSTRASHSTVIHFGGIASGNQVIKSGETRDHLARELDIISFEMQAAGLMDVLPCLSIRGICDYSDSHKNEDWQKYAAGTAAAYAREFLAELHGPIEDPKFSPAPEHGQTALMDRREQLLYSLRFDKLEFRKSTIKPAYGKTCEWFLNHPDYQLWLGPAGLRDHRGFLWVSGKPGVGKSTMMKFAYLHSKKKARSGKNKTASFFFNARGESLEKSVYGMYRSLVFQLLTAYPDLQTVLDDLDTVFTPDTECPSLILLKDLFNNAIAGLGKRSFTCFIDALDECDEQQVVEMVQYFEELGEQSAATGVAFRACFSSRHYPYINIERGIRLTLESQLGHCVDLETYINKRLLIQDRNFLEQLRPQVLEKASGVFMWVVLVVDILNKEYRRGALALRRRLAEIPSNLSELFKYIIRRDNANMEDVLLCILWILYSKRPLKPTEFYHAIWSGLALNALADSNLPDISDENVGEKVDRLNRRVINCSKGLAEVTGSNQPTVQFIHESVRDFLVKDNGLLDLWPSLGSNIEAFSHEKLKQCCDFYLRNKLIAAIENDWGLINYTHPFLQYATQHIFHHADAVAKYVSQDQFLSSFPVMNWVRANNLFEKGKGGYPFFAALANGHKDAVAALLNCHSAIINGLDMTEGFTQRRDLVNYKKRTPLSWAAQEGHMELVKSVLASGVDIDERDQTGQTALVRAIENDHGDVAMLLISEGADVNAAKNGEESALVTAVIRGNEHMVNALIDAGADVNAFSGPERTVLRCACERGSENIARLLIERGASVVGEKGWQQLFYASESGNNASLVKLLIEKCGQAKDPEFARGVILDAASHGHETVMRVLLDNIEDVNFLPGLKGEALLLASKDGHETVVRLLLEHGANIEARDEDGRSVLLWALARGHNSVANILIDGGADLEQADWSEFTSLSLAAYCGREAVGLALVNRGLRVNARNYDGSTPVLKATQNGNTGIVQLLIANGADVNARDITDRTPVMWAVSKQHDEVAELLIENGADLNARDVKGSTATIMAASHGNTTILQHLIANNADIDIANDEEITPLMVACQKRDLSGLKVLLENGAKRPSSFGKLWTYSFHAQCEELILEYKQRKHSDHEKDTAAHSSASE
ncbi:uncharacterized protein DSM5745_07899 [Aspergillus mulundensis]|uniref:Nephrocystin 3-like N-terminal domain-containing protein n=1 Tax=Aspergillus mulundensis TaxID=1810919 RepID=A0A3D8RFB2_9EURO|nr:hypothetical protein DSM5745_07899 [Aspergillus mulundensis]RDW72727.1 hypothetical protein DSM5745_07899 [Aspergillus mulundensis]